MKAKLLSTRPALSRREQLICPPKYASMSLGSRIPTSKTHRTTVATTARQGTDWNQYEDFFRFTRGHFVCREAEQMAQRHVRFNMNELCWIAGNCMGRQCVNVEKCPDGMYSKAFLITMDDGQELVAKVPNPNAGQPHFTTASDVATMDFMRDVLKTPVPQVLAWSPTSRNAVKAEYIIMKKAEGVQLSTVWPTLDIGQKAEVIRSVAKYQRAWTKISFQQIGSLYCADNLKAPCRVAPLYTDADSGRPVTDNRFAVGPIQGRDWADSGRATIECDRGPWSIAESYKRAEIERDLHALESGIQIPRPLLMLCGPGLYQPNRKKKLRAGKIVLQALDQLLPAEEWASSFHLWHDDLHAENIFVSKSDPTEIVAFIDWQSAAIVPLLDHTVAPGYLNYDGPAIQGLERPKRPQLSEDSSDEERSAAWALFEAQMLDSGFRHLLKRSIEPALQALMWQGSDEYNVLNASRALLGSSEAYCLASIAALDGAPVQFSEPEMAEIQQDLQDTQASVHAMDRIKQHMGDLFPEKGIVQLDEYENAKEALRRIKVQVIDDFAKSKEDWRTWEKAWPFDD